MSASVLFDMANVTLNRAIAPQQIVVQGGRVLRPR